MLFQLKFNTFAVFSHKFLLRHDEGEIRLISKEIFQTVRVTADYDRKTVCQDLIYSNKNKMVCLEVGLMVIFM